MAYQTKTNFIETLPKSLVKQRCVNAILSAKLPRNLKSEMINFISRNIIQDCNKIAPNCLKAHLISTAKKLKLSSKKIASLKMLFKSKIGYKGYYLDNGNLRRVQSFNYPSNL